ncbi:hypothetical protein, partial [Sulfuriflexus sp.]|uniref:hypothetical protein n=1 Tax=Sulfuriflexus sp. TaxID=2015443 RepID=UPI0028CE67BC
LQRHGMIVQLKHQDSTQAIDVAQWGADEEFVVYPEGARTKSRVICPDPVPFGFLIAGHQSLLSR